MVAEKSTKKCSVDQRNKVNGTRLINLIGHRFGMLLVSRRADENDASNEPRWVCRCDCGSEVTVIGGKLRYGRKRDCGCCEAANRATPQISHGMSTTPTYRIWAAMIQRCHNEKSKQYPDYGGRGIKVCQRWHSFENFFADVGESPSGKQLDRINNNEGYSPENTRWVSRLENARNKRNTIFVPYEGRMIPLTRWCEITGAKAGTIKVRIYNGWSVERAISTPVRSMTSR